MTLEESAQIAKIITSLVSVFLLTISVIVAVSVYRWQRHKEKIDTARRLAEDLRHYNELVLKNEDLQEIAAASHRWGHLDKKDVVRMYRYFVLFNVALSLFEAKGKKAVNTATYEAQMNTFANTTFADKDFVKQHVFPRGYTKEFRKEIGDRWLLIDRDGTLNSE
jgi:uncharacterized membrane protein